MSCATLSSDRPSVIETLPSQCQSLVVRKMGEGASFVLADCLAIVGTVNVVDNIAMSI